MGNILLWIWSGIIFCSVTLVGFIYLVSEGIK